MRLRTNRRASVITASLAVVAVVFWHGRAWLAALPQWQARRALCERDPQAALSWLDLADRLHADDGETQFLRARAYRKDGRFDLAREHVQLARDLGVPVMRLQREQVLAQAQAGQLRDAEPHLAGLLVDPQGDELEICEAFTNGYLLNSRLQDAQELLNTWILDYPEDPLPHLIRGQLHVQASQYPAAEQSFRRVLERVPSHHQAAYELARVLVLQQRAAAALELFARVSTEPSLRARGTAGEAACLRILGRSDEARRLLEELTGDDAGSVEVLRERGRLDMDDGRPAEAVQMLRRAYRQRPHDYETRYVLATALRNAGHLEEATEHFNWCQNSQAELTRAARLAERVWRKPDDVQSRFEIGRIQLGYGDPLEGVKWLQGVLNLDSRHEEAHQLLAAYYEERAKVDADFNTLANQHRTAAAGMLVTPAEAPRDVPE